MEELAVSSSWDATRYSQGYIRAMFDMLDFSDLITDFEETQ